MDPTTRIDATEVGNIEMFSTSKRNSALDWPTTTEPSAWPAGLVRNIGSPPEPRTVVDTDTAWKPSSATVSVALTGPGWLGVKVSRTVQSPPGGTGAPRVQVLSSSLIWNRVSDTVTFEGVNVVGPSLLTATYHSSLVKPTKVVPRSPSASANDGGLAMVTT